MVSCGGVFFALPEGYSIIECFSGVPRRHQRCWVGLDLQRQISVAVRGIHRDPIFMT